ncbi:MAG: hypothetical protein LBT19_02730, partial [Candidatus Nomurabacteria bacterium]|nr:hypothetical protein [Candidatus Nomurabacteria bacterium]
MSNIPGILDTPQPSNVAVRLPAVRFKYGTPNVAEATNVTLELFDLLGLIGDLGAARESLT